MARWMKGAGVVGAGPCRGPELEGLERSVLFDVTRLTGRFHPAPGDSLFMATRPGGPTTGARIVLVRNWVSELLARAQAVRD
jgi:hypothetical protein